MKKTEKTIAQPAIGNPVQHIRRTNCPRLTNHEQTQTIPSASITTPTKAVLKKTNPYCRITVYTGSQNEVPHIRQKISFKKLKLLGVWKINL